MKPKRSLASVAFELLVVLLVTAFVFAWGRQTARIERGYNAIGGEYLLLLLPAIYYTGKRTILDWIADIIGTERLLPYIPAWCPERKKTAPDGANIEDGRPDGQQSSTPSV